MFPAILSRSFWKIACAQSTNTASSEHLNERVWTKDVSKRKSEMASIYHLPIPKHRFQKHSEYVVNLDKVLFECIPYMDTGTTILTSLVDLLSDSYTHKGRRGWKSPKDIWSLCGCRNSTISTIHGCRPILVIIFDLVPTGFRPLVKVNFCPLWDVKQCTNMPRNGKSDWGRWSSESKTVSRVFDPEGRNSVSDSVPINRVSQSSLVLTCFANETRERSSKGGARACLPLS